MQSLWDFLYSGVYDFVTDAFVLLTKMAIKGWFEMQLFVAEIGYKAFKEVVGGIGIGSTITSYYSSGRRPALAAGVLRPAGRGEHDLRRHRHALLHVLHPLHR